MAGAVLYDWRRDGHLEDWKLEGNGELLKADDGALLVRTFHCGPGRRAVNVWLKALELPEAYRVAWRFRSDAAAGNAMLMFNARPLGLSHLFEDPRPDARYCDLAGYGKMVLHTLGFHRAVYGQPSNLRKLGGHVPAAWGQAEYPGAAWQEMNRDTTMSSTAEPLTAADLGREQSYALEHTPGRVRAWLNGALLHDWTDGGAYAHFKEPLRGGKIGLRNFGGYAEDFYSGFTVSAL
ncbi:MAG: hypothetical protein AMXMBFR7_29390 [Planctomycetota bacterium]